MRGFKKYHPFASAVFLLSVTLITAFLQHPLFTAVSLITASLTAVSLKGIKALKPLLYILPFYLFACVINLLFNNAGVTVLFVLPTGNNATLETLAYSLNSGAAMAALVMWFYCSCEIFTSDKVAYLLGCAAPKLGLLLTMILRFVPLLARRIKQCAHAQRFIGCDVYSGGPVVRVKNAVKVLSTAIAACAEGAARTAVSMKGRGYGIKGVRRTSYTVFRFAAKEAAVTVAVFALTAAIAAGGAFGAAEYGFYPYIFAKTDAAAIILAAAWTLLCVIPLSINLTEKLRISEVKHIDAV